MKKLFITWGFVAAALTLFSCAKQETIVNDAQPTQAGVPFELVAGVDTKTATTDASTINWVANDALNVFVAEHNSAFGANKQFTTADGTSTFSGVLESALDGAKTYDWKVFYPYNEDILTVNTHDGTKGYLTLGSKTNATQTQSGNNNKAHLAGSHMPLYGVGNGVAGDGTPNISLTQVMSVVEVKVTNKTDSPLVVSSVDFTAPAGTLISGTFFLDFSGNTPVFESSGAPYTSNVAKLTVTDGVAIAKNGYAYFYIAVKPFTVSSGTITVAVNGYEKNKAISSEVVFAAGKIKTFNFDYDTTVESFTWDLSTNSYSSASEAQVTWSHEKASMIVDKSTSTTAANNYLGGDSNHRTSSRIYANSLLTITPASGRQITKVVFVATSNSYANALKNSVWSNANASVSESTVSITPVDGSVSFNAKIGATCGFTSVSVYHKPYVPKVLTGIVITTPPTKTDYIVGDVIDMAGAVINATYDDSSEENVTASVTTDAETVLAHAGSAKPVTVSYLGKTATFNVNVAKGEADLSYATASYTVVPNASLATPILTNPHGLVITYTSSNETLVLVDENTGDLVIGNSIGGPVTITATAVANADYNAGTASYTITISDAAPDSEEIDFSSLSLENGVAYNEPFNGGSFTVRFDKNGNTGKYYETGNAIRVYAGGSFVVSSTSYTIAKIELTYGSGDGSNEITTNSGTFSTNTWTGSSESVTFAVGGSSGHRRIQKIKVTYK